MLELEAIQEAQEILILHKNKHHDLVNNRFLLRQLLESALDSVNDKVASSNKDRQNLENLYKEVGIYFNENVTRKLEDTRIFHKKAVQYRGEF